MNDPRADVIKKALSDPKFKAELLKNPNAAITAATGVKIPAGLKVKIVEDSAATVHLVLPLSTAPGQLSEKDLGTVSGGGNAGWPICQSSQVG